MMLRRVRSLLTIGGQRHRRVQRDAAETLQATDHGRVGREQRQLLDLPSGDAAD